jgi:hypothetical protein
LIVITVHYTSGREAKTSYLLDLNKSWPVAPAKTSKLRLMLNTIAVKWDGSGGSTGWIFDVLADGKPLLHLPNKNYSDGRGYSPELEPVVVAADNFERGQPVHLEVRGKRSFGGDTATGEVDLTASGAGPLLVDVTNKEDPKKGSFVFHFAVDTGQ